MRSEPGRQRRFDPDGNERLVSAAGLLLLVLTLVELGTLLLGLQRFLSLHVVVGLVLLPPIALKLAGTGWRFVRYYTRNPAYRLKGAPQLVMRMLAPLLVFLTVVLFGSGVAMGFVHGHALQVARRLHGPAAFGWTILVAAHVLVYLRRAVRAAGADLVSGARGEARGARRRASIVVVTVAAALAVGVATLPADHHWLHLPPKHDHEHARR